MKTLHEKQFELLARLVKGEKKIPVNYEESWSNFDPDNEEVEIKINVEI